MAYRKVYTVLNLFLVDLLVLSHTFHLKGGDGIFRLYIYGKHAAHTLVDVAGVGM